MLNEAQPSTYSDVSPCLLQLYLYSDSCKDLGILSFVPQIYLYTQASIIQFSNILCSHPTSTVYVILTCTIAAIVGPVGV